MSNTEGEIYVYTRCKQNDTCAYYQTDDKIPHCLSKEIKIDKDRGFHNLKNTFKNMIMTQNPNGRNGFGGGGGQFQSGLFPIDEREFRFNFKMPNGEKIKLKIKFLPDNSLLKIKLE